MGQVTTLEWIRANPGAHTAREIADGTGDSIKVVSSGIFRLRRWGDVICIGTCRKQSLVENVYCLRGETDDCM